MLISKLDPDEVLWDRFRPGPLAGLTGARARLIDDVLHGYRVRFWSVDELKTAEEWRGLRTDRERQVWNALHPNRPYRPDGEVGIFIGLSLDAFEFRIATSKSDSGTRISSGVSRHLGVGALGDLEVLDPDPWAFCADCCCWRPRYLVMRRYDDTSWADDPDDAYYHETVCVEDCQG